MVNFGYMLKTHHFLIRMSHNQIRDSHIEVNDGYEIAVLFIHLILLIGRCKVYYFMSLKID